jgi:crotonobetainyl-CoA:carnitine CoA-transferase CaiB-like acyl-CoA transferase
MTGALDGLRVLDLGQYVAGPLVAMILADQGAEVIRVDPPGGPRWQVPGNAVLQRGKRSLQVDLRKPAGHATVRRLADTADVLVENFRPGVLGRLGLGPDEFAGTNPGLVYCSLPGFGSEQ